MNFISQFNWLDIIIVIVILIFALYGLKQGFLKGLLALCVWIIAGFLAYYYSSHLSSYFSKWVIDQDHRVYLSSICIIISCWIVGALLIYIILSIFKKDSIAIPDHILGFLFGIIKGILVTSAILAFCSLKSSINSSFVWDHSKLTPPLARLSSWVVSIFPEHQTKHLEGIHNQVNELNEER